MKDKYIDDIEEMIAGNEELWNGKLKSLKI